MEHSDVAHFEHQFVGLSQLFIQLFNGLTWDSVVSSCLNRISGEEMSLACETVCVTQHARSLRHCCLYISAFLFLSDKMRMRLETCIICNRYHSLMVSAFPLAAHNGPFLRFSASCSAFWWWRNGDSGCHLGRNKKNDGTFHLLVRKLALLALHMVCMQRVLVRGVADNKEEKIALKEKHLILSLTLRKQKI